MAKVVGVLLLGLMPTMAQAQLAPCPPFQQSVGPPVLVAAAPRFPDGPAPALGEISAEVCVYVGDDGVPIGAVVQSDVSAGVARATQAAARLWRFALGTFRDRSPVARLRFVFRVLPERADREEEIVLFRPPYEVEVRRLSRRPASVASR